MAARLCASRTWRGGKLEKKSVEVDGGAEDGDEGDTDDGG